jgi:hypothetical protein
MKKLLLVVFASGIGGMLFAQQTPDKPESSQQASPAMQAIQIATSLAKYGYANYSASALIEAAEILAQTPTQNLGDKPSSDTKTKAKAETKATSKPEFTPKNLLADAKKYAAGDASMLAWADKVEKSLSNKTRGALGGPRQAFNSVYSRSTDTYQLTFRAGQLAEIGVSGDGDTDLDLYVYDANGNLIAYDEGYSDDCFVNWVPKWTGAYTIKVVNRGRVYNQYAIVTN